MNTPTQTSFAELEYASKKRQTRREKFLAEMAQLVPWTLLLAQLEPHYPKSGRRGWQPMALNRMLRIYCMQQWFSYSDRQMEDALYEIDSIRRFAGFGSVTEALPDETTILNFRHWLEKHKLTEVLLSTVNDHLKNQGLLASKGTMVDATIIHAPSSTKNQDQTRDPDMHQTKKGNQWYFGMKIHVGADVNSGAVHSVTVTAANTADIEELPKLLREDDQVIFADAGYTSDDYKKRLAASGLSWCVNDKRKPGKNLSSSQRKRNRKYSSVRARVEYIFRIIKCQFGFRKTRYRGLEKNTAQVNWLVGLANLYLLRRQLMAA
ncbi:IS5 family transposase [Methylicorpusculum oleiharenae]|nr:IS5 family transposase [Methylicorpusculum oleiharenae]MCD2451133.1 IS5 family transposase [Methylicorpusculum oleiharenae]